MTTQNLFRLRFIGIEHHATDFYVVAYSLDRALAMIKATWPKENLRSIEYVGHAYVEDTK